VTDPQPTGPPGRHGLGAQGHLDRRPLLEALRHGAGEAPPPSLVIRVEPAGVELVLEDGETLFLAAGRAGYKWPTICGGQGTCRTCFVRIQEGAENCSPMEPLETEAIHALRQPLDGSTRLACQLRTTGPVTVTKRGVRRRTED
jgi:chlorosome envelope protein X